VGVLAVACIILMEIPRQSPFFLEEIGWTPSELYRSIYFACTTSLGTEHFC
jgi:hypothetical protein